MEERPVLQIEDVSKAYFANKVLEGVNISIRRGEVHALVGENGAGKSTLMNILFGMPVIHETGGYSGTIRMDGETVAIANPRQAISYGLGMVHQEFMLIPGFTVAENIKLNREPLKQNLLSRVFGRKLMRLDEDAMSRDARKALDLLDLHALSEHALVGGLPVGYMQFVEIARELDKTKVRLLIFDEPTAVLTEGESSLLLTSFKRLASMGIAILFITHKLDEVIEIADRITVLKDGRVVGCMAKEETAMEELAALMVGRKVERFGRKETTGIKGSITDRENAISMRNFSVRMPGEAVRGLDLDIPKGSIFGIGGLAGQGKAGIANGIMGLYPAGGTVLVNGVPLRLNRPEESLRRGMAFVSEDRRCVGLLLDESIEINMVMTAMYTQKKYLHRLGPFSLMNRRQSRAEVERMIELLDIRCAGMDQPVRRLSGGNQQKVCLSRAILLEPEILFVSEPTRGVDIGAKHKVLDFLVALNQEKGITIVMTSSELAEMKAVCDEIAVIVNGRLEGKLPPIASDVDFGLMLSGTYRAKHKQGEHKSGG